MRKYHFFFQHFPPTLWPSEIPSLQTLSPPLPHSWSRAVPRAFLPSSSFPPSWVLYNLPACRPARKMLSGGGGRGIQAAVTGFSFKACQGGAVCHGSRHQSFLPQGPGKLTVTPRNRGLCAPDPDKRRRLSRAEQVSCPSPTSRRAPKGHLLPPGGTEEEY